MDYRLKFCFVQTPKLQAQCIYTTGFWKNIIFIRYTLYIIIYYLYTCDEYIRPVMQVFLVGDIHFPFQTSLRQTGNSYRRRTHPMFVLCRHIQASVSQTQRAEHDAHGLRSAAAAYIPHRAGGPQPGGTRRQENADPGPRGPMGGHTGEHVQELGERARVAVKSRGGPGRGPEGRACFVRAGREPAGQENTHVESQPGQPASDAGERVESPGRHSRRRCQAG